MVFMVWNTTAIHKNDKLMYSLVMGLVWETSGAEVFLDVVTSVLTRSVVD